MKYRHFTTLIETAIVAVHINDLAIWLNVHWPILLTWLAI